MDVLLALLHQLATIGAPEWMCHWLSLVLLTIGNANVAGLRNSLLWLGLYTATSQTVGADRAVDVSVETARSRTRSKVVTTSSNSAEQQ